MVNTLAAREVVRSVVAAARQWSDCSYAPRLHAAGAASRRLGYPPAMVATAFDRLFMPLGEEAIEATIAAELGSVDVLDGFVPRRSQRLRALPIGRVCIVSSRTTIGVALIPAIFALCAGCEVNVKDREDDLIQAFFRTLTELQPALTPRVAAAAWSGERHAVDLGAFEAVVAFGSNDTLADIARRLPFTTRFIPHAAKASAGYITAAALRDAALACSVARGAATDALLYDGEGCMSLHVLFVESCERPLNAQFERFLRDALAEAALSGAAAPSPSAAARVALQRDEAILSGEARCYWDEGASHVLVVERSSGDPPLLLSRALNMVVVSEPSDAAAYLQRHGITLEALAVTGDASDYAELAAISGASRITRFGTMQSPPVAHSHGGRPRIADFVRWIADET